MGGEGCGCCGEHCRTRNISQWLMLLSVIRTLRYCACCCLDPHAHQVQPTSLTSLGAHSLSASPRVPAQAHRQGRGLPVPMRERLLPRDAAVPPRVSQLHSARAHANCTAERRDHAQSTHACACMCTTHIAQRTAHTSESERRSCASARSLFFLRYLTVSAAHRYRRACLDHIREHEDHYKHYLEVDVAFREYLHKMALASSWGGHIEIDALSKVYVLAAPHAHTCTHAHTQPCVITTNWFLPYAQMYTANSFMAKCVNRAWGGGGGGGGCWGGGPPVPPALPPPQKPPPPPPPPPHTHTHTPHTHRHAYTHVPPPPPPPSLPQKSHARTCTTTPTFLILIANSFARRALQVWTHIHHFSRAANVRDRQELCSSSGGEGGGSTLSPRSHRGVLCW
jgi:hypothetical protein